MPDVFRSRIRTAGRRILLLAISCSFLAAVIWFAEPSSTLNSLGELPIEVLCAFFVLLGVNLFVVSFRFWRVLTYIGIDVPWPVALRASMAGHLSSLFFIPLIGQVAGRQFYLAKAGVPPMVNASVAACERTLLAIMSGTLAAWGAVFLLGRTAVDRFVTGLALEQVLLVASAGFLLSLLVARKGDGFVRSNLNRKNLARFLEIAAITLAGQLLMLSCFMLGFHSVAPEVDPLSLFAASAVVSFAASLPISIGGWGVREMASVFVLQLFGVPASNAIAVSILIGLFSMLVLFLAVPVITRKDQESTSQNLVPQADAITLSKVEGILTWMFGTVVALFLFFQVHVPVSGSKVTLNLADPFAMLTLAALGLQVLQLKRFPTWRLEGFNFILTAMGAMLVVGFCIGWSRIGVTQWALGNRLMGWLVLMGYCATGTLLAARLGRHGLRRMVETMASVVCVVIIVQVSLRLLTLWGWDFEGIDLGYNFEGYSGNRNTFAFQLLCVASLLLGYDRLYSRYGKSPKGAVLLPLFLGTVMFGTFLTGSRAGLGTMIILLVVALAARIANWRLILLGLGTSLALWALMVGVTSWHASQGNAFLHLDITREYFQQAELVRWKANSIAAQMWLEHPILGAGLGAFFAASPSQFGQPVVVHSTPLWILAEFGLVGAVVYGWCAFVLLRFAVRRFRGAPPERALFLMLLAFCLFCQVHEIMYQRIFWFLLGALLALRHREAPIREV